MVANNNRYSWRVIIFPVSTAILERISDYRDVLESYSHPRLDLIQWEETKNHNVRILNDTIDLYRYCIFRTKPPPHKCFG